MRKAIDHWKAKGLDFSRLLAKPEPAPGDTIYNSQTQDHGLEKALDNELLKLAAPALENGEKVSHELEIVNTNRTVGTILSHNLVMKHGEQGLPTDTIHFKFNGSAGQSFGAFPFSGSIRPPRFKCKPVSLPQAS